MNTRVQAQLLRGSTAQNDAYTGRPGELSVDTELGQLRLHDGVIPGGKRLPFPFVGDAYISGSLIVVNGQARTVRYDNGEQSGSFSVNWNNGNHQSITLTGSVDLTFTNGGAGGVYSLELRYGGTYTVTWPLEVLWPDENNPYLTSENGKKDIFTFYHDGTYYNGQTFGNNYLIVRP